jgi:rod shape-determining protein MreD
VRNAALLLAGVLLLMAQTALGLILRSDHLTPSLVLPMVLYMSVGEFSLARGVSVAFVLGYLTDLFSGGSLGLWTFTLVSVFLLARVAGLKLFLHGVVFQTVLTFVASCVAGVGMMGLLLVFDRRVLALLPALGTVASQAVATALFAPLVFRFAQALPGAAPRVEESG